MASATYGNQIFGLRDIKVTNSGGTTQEDLGAASSMELNPMLVSGNLEGDDAIKGVISFIVGAEWSMAAGEYSEAALEIITGLTTAVTSTSPTEVSTIQFDEGTRMPYFKIYGQAYDEAIGDLQVLIPKAKCTAFTAYNLNNGDWRVTELSGVCIDDGSNGVWKSVQHETAVAVPAS